MTNEQIEARLHQLVKIEKRITAEIVRLIQLAYERKIHLRNGHKSVQRWLMQEYKFSEGSANRRISAARILDVMPEAAAKIETGEINLSTLTQVQTAIRREETRIGESLPLEQKQQLVRALENKTMAETDALLARTFPQTAPPEKIRPINESQSLMQLTVDPEFLDLLEQAKALISNATNPETITTLKAALKSLIITTKAKQSPMHRELLKRSEGQCEYVGKDSRRCTARHTLQKDHVNPKAKGGSDQIENRRILCQAHNFLEAEREFGAKKIRTEIRARRSYSRQASRTSEA